MKNSFFSDTLVIRLFNTVGINNRIAVPLLRTVKLWLTTMGSEETVSRIKTLKTYFLTGMIPDSATWIALQPDGTPKGPFRPLWRLPEPKALNIFGIYTSFVSGKLTTSQWNKFYNSAMMEVPSIDEKLSSGEVECLPSLKDFRKTLRSSWNKVDFDTLSQWTNSSTKTAGGYDHRNPGFVWGPESDLPFDFHLGVLVNVIFTDIDQIRTYEEAGIEFTKFLKPFLFKNTVAKPIVGKVSVIQEKGMKARIVANPFRVHQLALSKLGNFLRSVLRHLPWDCTFDQMKGVDFVSQSLSAGKTVFCYDLSDATNCFPYELQDRLLKLMADQLPEKDGEQLQKHRKLLRFLVKGVWFLPQEAKRFCVPNSMYVKWTRGQPLGLYPSFYLFALTHGLVIHAIEQGCKTSDTFRVLGDDVVISHPEVAAKYLQLLSDLEVPVSIHKSVVSDRIGEFAGKVILKDGPLMVEKWKVWSQKDVFSVYRWLGIKGEILVPKSKREMMRFIVSLPQPLGLGLNPRGFTVNQRLQYAEILISKYWEPELLSFSEHRERKEQRRDAIFAFKKRGFPMLKKPLQRRTDVAVSRVVSHLNANAKSNDLSPLLSAWFVTIRPEISGRTGGWKKVVTALRRFIFLDRL